MRSYQPTRLTRLSRYITFRVWREELLMSDGTLNNERYQQLLIGLNALPFKKRKKYQSRFLQNRFVIVWKHTTEICQPMRLTHQTGVLPIVAWSACLLSRTLLVTIMYENGLVADFRQKKNSLLGGVTSPNC